MPEGGRTSYLGDVLALVVAQWAYYARTVRGTALVERDGEEQLVGENQSTYIPMGCHHRLSNPGRIAVEMIEVQSGEYLGEDDIVRFEDVYGRGDQGKRAA